MSVSKMPQNTFSSSPLISTIRLQCNPSLATQARTISTAFLSERAWGGIGSSLRMLNLEKEAIARSPSEPEKNPHRRPEHSRVPRREAATCEVPAGCPHGSRKQTVRFPVWPHPRHSGRTPAPSVEHLRYRAHSSDRRNPESNSDPAASRCALPPTVRGWRGPPRKRRLFR